jgi:hypothetical protein
MSSLHALDPVAFARDRLGFEPDRMQARVLDPAIRRGILNCSRQWGKSTVTAVLGVHRAVHVPKSNVLIVSPTARQSGELLLKMTEFVERLGIKPCGDGKNRLSLRLPNRSRVIGLPGVAANIRGFTASLVLVDEAALVGDGVFTSIRPVLAVGRGCGNAGDMWLMSTPQGQRGFFYEQWTRPEFQWTRISVPATECPRISPAFLEEERLVLGEQAFRQEYMCEFLQDVHGFFQRSEVEACLTDEIPPLFDR